MTDREQRARTALIRTEPCTHDMVGEEDICDGCKYQWEKSLVQRVVNFSAEEVKLAMREVVKGLRESISSRSDIQIPRFVEELCIWIELKYQL